MVQVPRLFDVQGRVLILAAGGQPIECGMGLKEGEQALARGEIPRVSPPRHQRRVGVFRVADSRIYIITQF